jgi:transposase
VYGPRVAAPSKLEPHKGYLKWRLRAGVWNAAVLLRELRECNYEGGYTILKDWLQPQRKQAVSIAVQRFETSAGKHKWTGGILARCRITTARASCGASR